jgi:ElaB/YqjD/DUF883 family membrane-anchored ribosome-binding protein
VDEIAASTAASTGLSPDGDKQKDPLNIVREQIDSVLQTTWCRIKNKLKQTRHSVQKKANHLIQLIFKYVKIAHKNFNDLIKTS